MLITASDSYESHIRNKRLCAKAMLNNIRRKGQKIAIFWSGYRFFALYLRRKEIPAEIWAESPRGKVYC